MRDIFGAVCAYDVEWAGEIMRRYPDQHLIIRSVWRWMMEVLKSPKVDKKDMSVISTNPLVRIIFVYCYPGASWSIGHLSCHEHFRTDTARSLLSKARIILRRLPYPDHQVRRVVVCDPVHAERVLASGSYIHPRVLRGWSRNPSFPIILIIGHQARRWDWVHVWRHRMMTPDHVGRLASIRRMNYKLLSMNPFLSIRHILNDTAAPWDWKKLAVHPSMPPQDIMAHPSLVRYWRFEEAILNPRVSDTIYHQIGRRFRWGSKRVIANGLRCSHTYRAWAMSRVRIFMINAIRRRCLLQRVALIGCITGRMPGPIVSEVLRFITT